MSEKERDLVHALSGEKRAARHGVPKAVHGGQLAVSHGDRTTCLVGLVKDGKRRPSKVIHRVALSVAKRSTDVPLPQRTAESGREDEMIRLGETRRELVTHEDHCQLLRDRHCPRRTVRLRGPALAFAIDLPRELDLRVVEVLQANIRPGDREQPETRAPVRAARVNRVRHGSAAAATVCSSSAPSKIRRRLDCDGLGRSDENIRDTGFAPDQPSLRAANR